jgi:hypothetical protein
MKFDEWFTSQFGPSRLVNKTHEQLHEMVRMGKKAKEELERRIRMEDLRNAALSAWQVKDEDKQ